MAEETLLHEYQPLTREEIPIMLKEISGEAIERQLIELASFGGRQIQGTESQTLRYATNRVALTEPELQSRVFLKKQMEEAGMTVEEHPLGLIGTYEGSESTEPAIGMVSHFDTVPEGGMYDGTVGVISAIDIVRHLNEAGKKSRRSLKVIALTGEESAGYNMALFGSKGMLEGLTDEELQMKKENGKTIEQALIEAGFDPDVVKKPFINPKDYACMFELHVDQTGNLEAQKLDLEVIDAIAAPDRRRITVGEPLRPDDEEFQHTHYLELRVEGVADHSGATPMGSAHRADGLVGTAQYLFYLKFLQNKFQAEGKKVKISLGAISVDGEAMNKIPGRTTTQIRITGEDEDDVSEMMRELTRFYGKRNEYYDRRDVNHTRIHEKFPDSPVELLPVKKGERYYPPENHYRAMSVVRQIYGAGNANRQNNIVATVGTISADEGQPIRMGLDMRGIHGELRQQAMNELQSRISRINDIGGPQVQMTPPLPGSGEPVRLNAPLATFCMETLEHYDVGTYTRGYSPAGHDAMRFQEKGISTVMLFIPSENGGISHNPEEYTSPQALEIGEKGLAAIVLELATKEDVEEILEQAA